MKKILLVGLSLFTVLTFAQQQIGNSDFESWDNVGTEDVEPTNWNSFMSANCTLGVITCGFGQNKQVDRSTDFRPGSSGIYSARVYSISVLGVVANGNMTLGRINMGSTTASSSSNYNYSITSDANFSEAFTDAPDSVVFWIKSNISNANDSTRVSAVIHNNTDGYKDPNDVSGSNTVATAIKNFERTSGTWVRKSIPFNYVGNPADAAYIMVTVTTNKTPGGGNSGDEVFIDDLELIYNPSVSISEKQMQGINVKSFNNALNFTANGELNGTYEVYDLAGSKIQSGIIQKSVPFTQKTGVYFVRMNSTEGTLTKKIYKQ